MEGMHGRFSAADATDTRSAGMPLSVEEENALLHVLGAVCGLPPASLGSVSASKTSSVNARAAQDGDAKKPKKKRSHTTPTRDRELKELRGLRVEAVELTTRLEELRAAIVGHGGSGTLTKRQRVWRHVARRQLALRRQAENERKRLVCELEAHRGFVRAIQSRWMGLSNLERNDNCTVAIADDADGGDIERSILEERERNVLDRLASQLDDAYALVGLVLPPDKVSAHDVSRLLSSAVDANNWLGPEVGYEEHHDPIELRDEVTIPFGLEQVVDAVWRSWVQWHVGGASRITGVSSAHCAHSRVDRPEDTFAVKFRLKCSPGSSSHGEQYLNETLVVRRYVESDRLVLVWRGTSEGDHAGLDTVLTDETGWIVVECMRCDHQQQCSLFGEETNADAALCHCGGHTTLRSYVRMVPRTRSKSSTDDRSFGGSDVLDAPRDEAATTLANLVAELYRQDVNFIHREMETLLIREAHRSSSQYHGHHHGHQLSHEWLQ